MTDMPKRGSVSINRRLFDEFHAWCDERKLSLASVIERLIAAETGLPLPEHARPGRRPQSGRITTSCARRSDAAPGADRGTAIQVDVGTAAILADLVVRERELHGRAVTRGELLDAAINRFLDAQRWPATAAAQGKERRHGSHAAD